MVGRHGLPADPGVASPGRVTLAAVLLLLVPLTLACAKPRTGSEAGSGASGAGAGGTGTGGLTGMTGGTGNGGNGGSSAAADGPPPVEDPRCPPGRHTCNGQCVDSSSPETCGSACTPCPTVPGATATCDGVACGVRCPAGKRLCLTACIDEGQACNEVTCPAGKNPCGGACVDATSLAACGPGCAPCPTSPNGITSCDGTRCQLTCSSGYHRCGDECRRDDSADSCGTSCTPCPSQTAGTGRAVCRDGACAIECAPFQQLQGTACVACGLSEGPCCVSGPACQSSFACRNGRCVYPCGGAGEPCCDGNACTGGLVCVNGYCGDKRPNGDSCNSPGECASGRCTDGSCCGETCGPCETCTGANGTCQLPANVKVCNGSCIPSTDCCNCNTSTRCDGNRVVAGFCDNGTCSTRTVDQCGNCEECSGSSCRPRSCGSNQVCIDNQCKRRDGQGCSSDDQCANGRCGGPRFCRGGSNANCPCTSDGECESQSCQPESSLRTCGGEDCSGYTCDSNPPTIKTCDVKCGGAEGECRCSNNRCRPVPATLAQ